jgi:hypothetical protein
MLCDDMKVWYNEHSNDESRRSRYITWIKVVNSQIYNIIDNPAMLGYLRWKLKPFFPQHLTPWSIKISELKEFISGQYLKDNGSIVILESMGLGV